MQNQSSKFAKIGLPPGTLIHVGQRKIDKAKLSVIDYTKTDFERKVCEQHEDCYSYRDKESVSWVNIDGLHDVKLISEVGKHFSLHQLILEDVMDTKLRPKVEYYDNCIFLSLKMMGISEDRKDVVFEQVSLVLGEHWVISFQEMEGDVFEPLRQRIEAAQGVIRGKNVEYLFYRMMDIIVDHYFYVTDYLTGRIEELEEKVLDSTEPETLVEIQNLKRTIIASRKCVTPLREAISTLQRETHPLKSDDNQMFYRDLYEHIIQLNESLESSKEVVSGITDLYHSMVSNKMNQVMKVLTVIATIFIPLTFIAGIYGMNFKNMPELEWEYGYQTAWGIMITVGLGMVLYFKNKKWL